MTVSTIWTPSKFLTFLPKTVNANPFLLSPSNWSEHLEVFWTENFRRFAEDLMEPIIEDFAIRCVTGFGREPHSIPLRWPTLVLLYFQPLIWVKVKMNPIYISFSLRNNKDNIYIYIFFYLNLHQTWINISNLISEIKNKKWQIKFRQFTRYLRQWRNRRQRGHIQLLPPDLRRKWNSSLERNGKNIKLKTCWDVFFIFIHIQW